MFTYYRIKKNGTLYIGVTNNLIRRSFEHKEAIHDGFSKKYQISKLVYYEQYQDIEFAILREKQLKHWNRQWKIGLIEKFNSNWIDLYDKIIE